MIFYSYDENNIFVGEVTAQVNPRNKNEYLQPAKSTNVICELEDVVGKVKAFDGEAWNYLPNEKYVSNKLLEVSDLGTHKFIINSDGFIIDNPEFSTVENTKLQAIADKEQAAAEAKVFTDLYNTMVADIYTEMNVVFGTLNDASASAFAATWEAMVKRPANYIDVDLGFSDESAVLSFANSKLLLADAYGVFRMKRLVQYEVEKTALLGA